MVAICVVGAGVIGLSTAVSIQRAISNVRVTVLADKFLKQTTSDIAAGAYRFTGPILVSGWPESAGSDIAKLSWDWLNSLERRPDSRQIGVIRISGYDVQYPGIGHNKNFPQYLEHVFSYKKLSCNDLQRLFPTLPIGSTGWFCTTLLIECRQYLQWLSARITEAGGKILERHVGSFEELFDEFDIVVNCAGLGAQQLAGDKELFPIRGQMMRVDAKEIKHFLYIDDGTDRPTYIYPTLNTVALGGTKQECNGCTQLSSADRQHIVSKCSEYMPSLQSAKVLGEAVGLRPHRHALKISAEAIIHKGQPRQIVHNYGHGGNGVAWSWGSAVLAARLVSNAVQALDKEGACKAMAGCKPDGSKVHAGPTSKL